MYRYLIPNSLRKTIYNGFLGKLLIVVRNIKILKRGLLINVFPFFYKKNSKNKAIKFLWNNGITSYPGEYVLKYTSLLIEVFQESTTGLSYVNHDGRKLYFPKSYDEDKIITLYKSLRIEQDPNSPHRYIKDYSELQDKTLIDIGAAEGIFSLDCIDYLKEVILIEADPKWIDALKATFAPYTDKVKIIKALVGDGSSDLESTLDVLFSNLDSEKDLFVKIDIEGYELKALTGAHQFFQNSKNISVAIATYHDSNHAQKIEQYFTTLNYSTKLSNGYIYWNRQLNNALLLANKCD